MTIAELCAGIDGVEIDAVEDKMGIIGKIPQLREDVLKILEAQAGITAVEYEGDVTEDPEYKMDSTVTALALATERHLWVHASLGSEEQKRRCTGEYFIEMGEQSEFESMLSQARELGATRVVAAEPVYKREECFEKYELHLDFLG